MYQKMTIAGNLGRDPEMRYLSSGQAVTNINVATNRVYTKDSGEKVTETTWFRVSIWGKRAETVNQYLRKGAKVLVEGRLQPEIRVYESKGEYKASYEMTASNVIFLSSKQEAQAYGGEDSFSVGPDDVESIPF